MEPDKTSGIVITVVHRNFKGGIHMVKKRKHKHKKSEKSPTKDFRNIAQVTMGAGMVGSMTPLISNPSAANIGNATQGMVGFAIMAPIASVGFDAIDNISKTGKKKK